MTKYEVTEKGLEFCNGTKQYHDALVYRACKRAEKIYEMYKDDSSIENDSVSIKIVEESPSNDPTKQNFSVVYNVYKDTESLVIEANIFVSAFIILREELRWKLNGDKEELSDGK